MHNNPVQQKSLPNMQFLNIIIIMYEWVKSDTVIVQIMFRVAHFHICLVKLRVFPEFTPEELNLPAFFRNNFLAT